MLQGAAAQLGAALLFGTFAVPAVSFALVGPQPGAIALALTAYLAAAVFAFALIRRGYPHATIGRCNLVTLTRLVLTAALLAAVVSPTIGWGVLVLAIPALALDGLDGWLAHRDGRVSEFGARFDLEVDAAFALVLALNAWAAGTAGAAVLLLAVPRYIFAFAALWWAWMARPLPQRFSRKVVCVLQIATLIGLQVPGLPVSVATASVTVAAVALCWSFSRDMLWLWRASK